jgi:hypothetical protein
MQVLEDTILAYQAINANKIQYFDLTAGEKMLKETVFERFGPNGIVGLYGYNYLNEDSIIVLGDHQYTVFLADDQARIHGTFPFPKDGPACSHPFGYGSFLPILREGKVYFSVGPRISENVASLAGQEMEMVLDLETGDLDYHFFYPEEYADQRNVYHVSFSRTVGYQGDFVYSFSAAPYLYRKTAAGEVSKHPVHSRFAKEVGDLTVGRDMTDYMEEEDAYVEDNAYGRVVYDSYREVYYLSFLHPIPSRDPATGLRRLYDEKPFSILIFDRELRQIGEYEAPRDRFCYKGFFVNSEGLWLSNNYKFNPDLDEDRLSFTLLRLVEK